MTRVIDVVALEQVGGIPRSMRWRDELYRVSDTPTRLSVPTAAQELMTHPLDQRGWRFQATSAAGEALVFDVVRTAGGWTLLDVYR